MHGDIFRLQLATNRHLIEKLHRLKKRKDFKIVKGGPLRLFKNPVCCKTSKK